MWKLVGVAGFEPTPPEPHIASRKGGDRLPPFVYYIILLGMRMFLNLIPSNCGHR